MEASCGPSNGVKQLQRHFDTDRSLHQSRQQQGLSSSSFRQAPAQASLERARLEQEQFLQGGRQFGRQEDVRQFSRQEQRSHVQPHDWAQDFQQSRAQDFQQSTGWGAEFMASTSMMPQPIMSTNSSFVMPTSILSANPSFMMSANPSFSIPTFAGQPSMPTAEEQAAFHQAFAEAEASFQQANLEEEEAVIGQPADSLADTAGELIHALRDEQSSKFKNSNFMALMHKLRDREVVIDEEKMVNVRSGQVIRSHRDEQQRAEDGIDLQ